MEISGSVASPFHCLGAGSETSNYVQLPRYLVQEVLADGCCPLHLRLQLARALTGDSVEAAAASPLVGPVACPVGLDAHCTSAIASFLAHDDLLMTRACSVDHLCGAMQRQPDEQEEILDSQGNTRPVELVHDRVRVRLWLQRLGEVARRTPDEHVFETSVQSFVDEALRRRLEDEVAVAKEGMEAEVHAAKANMLQCVQAISEEVDRRVRDKVFALQQEFEKRALEQAQGLRDMVEQRVSEQTEALRAEVDRRTECVRVALEQRMQEQEEAAARLRAEVANTRSALESRILEQEGAASRLNSEVLYLRQALRKNSQHTSCLPLAWMSARRRLSKASASRS